MSTHAENDNLELQFIAHEATKHLTEVISSARSFSDSSLLNDSEKASISLLCDTAEMLIGVILVQYGLEKIDLIASDLNDFIDHVITECDK